MIIEVGEERGMYRKRDYEEVTEDYSSIVREVKDIDPEYFILQNRHTGVFELHHMGQADSTFCIMLPFPQLDRRTIDRIHETRAEKFKELIAAMNAKNDKIDRDRQAYFTDYVKWVSKETYNYVNSHYSKETLDKGAFKTRFV
jgi:TRAP-type mannitol/chloroaromatic compound transport system substrate-binding protein